MTLRRNIHFTNAPWYFTVWRRVAGISFYNFRFWISIPGEISNDNMVSGIPERNQLTIYDQFIKSKRRGYLRDTPTNRLQPVSNFGLDAS